MKCSDGDIREILEVRKDTRAGHEGEYLVIYNHTTTAKRSATFMANDELDAYNEFIRLYRDYDEEET